MHCIKGCKFGPLDRMRGIGHINCKRAGVVGHVHILILHRDAESLADGIGLVKCCYRKQLRLCRIADINCRKATGGACDIENSSGLGYAACDARQSDAAKLHGGADIRNIGDGKPAAHDAVERCAIIRDKPIPGRTTHIVLK